MAAATIGALRVNLGLNSAQFSTGLNRASGRLRRFSAVARTGLLAVAAAGTAAAAGLAIAVKGAIDNADALSKTAQRVGMTTEALSRLQWAAKLSGVSVEGLSTGVKKLSQNMLEVSEGRGAQAASSLAALGVAVTDLEGNLRSSGDVLSEIATRFSNMEDGAQKTALAMNIFGRAGADMIPMLNQGASGLASMAAESDRLGLTISTRTGRAAEAFNDTLTRLQAVFGGIANKIAEAVLPSLNSLTSTLASPEFAASMQAFAVMTINVVNGIANAFITAHQAFKDFMEFINPTVTEFSGGSTRTAFPTQYQAALDDLMKNLELRNRGLGSGMGIYGFNDNFDFSQFEIPNFDAPTMEITQLGTAMAAANDNAIDLMAGLDQVGKTAAQMSIETATASATVFGSLAKLSSGLSNAFKDNKALAVATAVLKGAESIASSFAAGAQIGGPPLGALYAGIAAITAAANVSAVMSVSESSKSMPSAGGSAVGGAAMPAPVLGAGQSARPNITVVIEGTSHSNDNIEALIRDINEALGDGAQLNV